MRDDWWLALWTLLTEHPELWLIAAVDPPWRLDPLQNIINVSWGGGLAVEIFEGDI